MILAEKEYDLIKSLDAVRKQLNEVNIPDAIITSAAESKNRVEELNRALSRMASEAGRIMMTLKRCGSCPDYLRKAVGCNKQPGSCADCCKCLQEYLIRRSQSGLE